MPAEAPPLRLSLIVPVLDEAAGITAFLRTLQPLRARGVEVLVCDGGSRDGTAALAAPLADRVLTAPRGRASQMNAGAAVARAPVLLFLHADTLLPADGVDAALRAVAGGSDWGRYDVRITGASPLLPVVAALMNLRSRLTGIATGDQGIFVTRRQFQAVGGYPDVALMEDIALSARLRRRSPPACLRACVTTSGRRWERHGPLRTILHMAWLRLRYWLGADPDALARAYGYAPRRD